MDVFAGARATVARGALPKIATCAERPMSAEEARGHDRFMLIMGIYIIGTFTGVALLFAHF